MDFLAVFELTSDSLIELINQFELVKKADNRGQERIVIIYILVGSHFFSHQTCYLNSDASKEDLLPTESIIRVSSSSQFQERHPK